MFAQESVTSIAYLLRTVAVSLYDMIFGSLLPIIVRLHVHQSYIATCKYEGKFLGRSLDLTKRQFLHTGGLYVYVFKQYVVWEARVRCIQFWYKVLTSKTYEGRLLRKVVLQAVECGRGSWMRSIGRCVGRFG